MFSSPFSIAITLLWEEIASLLPFSLTPFCAFPLPLGVLEGLRFVIVALPGLFSYFFFVLLFDLHLFGFVWFCLFSLPLGVWEGLRSLINDYCTHCVNESMLSLML